MKYHHLTTWDLDKIETEMIYNTPTDQDSFYWELKIKGTLFTELQAPFFMNDIDSFIRELKEICRDDYEYGAELLKEHIFEFVRLKEFPDLPSRKKCLFLMDCQEDFMTFSTQNGLDQSPYKVVEIETLKETVKIHQGQLSLLDCETMPHETIVQNARKYWSGEIEENTFKEILFEGHFKITEILHVFS